MAVTDPSSPAVLVVGGGLGIGANTTTYLLSAHPTSRIVVFGLHISPSISALQSQFPNRLWIVQGDATKAEDRLRAKDFALSKMGKLDALVVTAGIMGQIARVGPGEKGESLSEEGLRRILEVNVIAPVFMVLRSLFVSYVYLLTIHTGSTCYPLTPSHSRPDHYSFLRGGQERSVRGLARLLRIQSCTDPLHRDPGP